MQLKWSVWIQNHLIYSLKFYLFHFSNDHKYKIVYQVDNYDIGQMIWSVYGIFHIIEVFTSFYICILANVRNTKDLIDTLFAFEN